jgi:hypothetical protein
MDERRPPRYVAGNEPTVVGRRVPRSALEPGTILANTYRIEAVMPGGDMGETYRARHVELGTTHAIKVILPALADNPQMVGLLVEEVRKLSRVRDDAIVNYEGLFRDERGLRFLVMEFVEGESLRTILARRRLEPHEVLELRNRLVRGLAAVHSRGIIHRNISVDDIILPEGDVRRAKLIDFGIAKSAEPAEATLIDANIVARRAYASPEQLGLYGGRVDSRSDIYSLGLVLAAAAIGFGKTLDMGTTLAAMIAARQHSPDLSALPSELRSVVAPMLQPKPEDRPPSMEALLDTAAAASAPPPEHGRRRWPALAATAAAIVIAVAGIGFAVSRFVAPPPTGEELNARLSALTAMYQCASLRYVIAPDRSVRFSGYVAAAEDVDRLRDAIGAIHGLGTVKFDVGVMGRPFCEVAVALAPLSGVPGRDPPTLAFSSKTVETHIGDRLSLDIRVPGFDGYVYVDYYDRGGQVLHLFPNDHDFFNFRPARNHFVVFKPPLTSCWTFNGNVGEELVGLIVTAKPLFPGPRQQIENIGDYLASLGPVLKTIAQGDGAAALLPFNLGDAAPWSGQEAACPPG